MTKKLYLFLARTARGKSTIAKEIEARTGLRLVRSFTTRSPRNEEERLGKGDHIFITDEEFDKIREEDIAAYTKIGPYRYCTTWEMLNQCQLYVIDPLGADDLRAKAKGRYEIYEIYVTLPEEEARVRYTLRGGAGFEERTSQEKAQFDAYEASGRADLTVENLDLEEAVKTVERFISSKMG